MPIIVLFTHLLYLVLSHPTPLHRPSYPKLIAINQRQYFGSLLSNLWDVSGSLAYELWWQCWLLSLEKERERLALEIEWMLCDFCAHDVIKLNLGLLPFGTRESLQVDNAICGFCTEHDSTPPLPPPLSCIKSRIILQLCVLLDTASSDTHTNIRTYIHVHSLIWQPALVVPWLSEKTI